MLPFGMNRLRGAWRGMGCVAVFEGVWVVGGDEKRGGRGERGYY